MTVRYLLVLSESEGIYCIGPLPRVGDQIKVEKRYAGTSTVVTVQRVVLTQVIVDTPYDERGYCGHDCGEVPEVYAQIEYTAKT